MTEIVQLGSEHPASYFDRIAELHIDTIHHGVLPVLGKRFLSRMYRELTGCPFCCVLGAVENGNVVGYLAGCADTAKSFIALLSRAGIPLLGLAFHASSDQASCERYRLSPLHAQRRKWCGRGRRGPEILAISVDPGIQRRGLGKKLVQAFERNLVRWGIIGHYSVATNEAEVVSKAFYTKVGLNPGCVRSIIALSCRSIEENPRGLRIADSGKPPFPSNWFTRTGK